MTYRKRDLSLVSGTAWFVLTFVLVPSPALAETNPWAATHTNVPVTVQVLEIAEIQFPNGTSGLGLTVPPAKSTIPSTGLKFFVRGNSTAWVSAKPEEFVLVQSYIVQGSDEGPFYLGKAVGPNDNVIGYNLMVEFPVFNYSGLTGNDNEGTPAHPVSVKNVAQKTGYLHLLASHQWTPDGSVPAVGVYRGDVVITVGAGTP